MEFFWVLAVIADLVFQCRPEYKSLTGEVSSIGKKSQLMPYTAMVLHTNHSIIVHSDLASCLE
jgi:hypothetical protein